MKIICIARNYTAHAAEMGKFPTTDPVFFCKPDSAILQKGNPFYIPTWTNNVQYEVELVWRISRLGKNIGEAFAHRYYAEIGLGIDFTARDVQQELKNQGLPWEKSKAFDGSAVLSQSFISINQLSNPMDIRFRLEKNGMIVQQGTSKDMIFSIDRIIAYVSQYMTMKTGDLIFTGTPQGVGPVKPGDVLEGWLEEKKMFGIRIK